MLNENLKTMRKAKGMSQEDLAARLSVVRQTVSKWEQGLSVPDAEMLIKIAAELNTTVNALLGETIAQESEPDLVAELAERLAVINEKMATQTERRRKRARIIYRGIGLLALLGLASGVVDCVHGYQVNKSLNSMPDVIGGVDTATSIYLSNVSVNTFRLLAAMICAIISIAGLIKTNRK